MKRLLAHLLIALCPPLDAAPPPNIILMMGDDHGWKETGYHGHPHVKTPVLDEMAATGLRLDRFYTAHPSCSPTRASFLTGRHPNRMGTFAPGWSFRPEETNDAQRVELHHLINDRAESKDLSKEHPEIVARLTKLALDWKATLPDKPNPDNISQ